MPFLNCGPFDNSHRNVYINCLNKEVVDKVQGCRRVDEIADKYVEKGTDIILQALDS